MDNRIKDSDSLSAAITNGYEICLAALTRKRKPSDGAVSRKPFDRVLREGIKPHSKALAMIADRGEFAVVALEPHAMALAALTSLDWQNRLVFGVTQTRMMEMADAGSAWSRWATRPSNNHWVRILVLMHEGAHLANYVRATNEIGFTCESRAVLDLKKARAEGAASNTGMITLAHNLRC